ncbi:hypothetical protein FRC07_001469, partial [Ceratobasidium sp. 392]
MASTTVPGYAIFRQCSSIFFEVAELYPEIRSPDSSISLHGALWSSHYEVCRFAFLDTILPLALAVPPLIRYNTTYISSLTGPVNPRTLESVFGSPLDILLLLGRINAWRVSRWMGVAGLNIQEFKDIRDQIECWRPSVEYIDESSNVIGRLTVHEAWRQSTLIYFYMGMCMANSTDPRVEAAVRQVVQLASTIKSGALLERHIFMPALIAGVAARQEQHRAVLRDKVSASRGQNIWLVPGQDFVTVLDHLWHGVGAD